MTREVAIITGAGSGIGLGCAVALAKSGMRIVGVGRNAEKLDELRRMIADSDQVATLAVDITEDDAPKRIVDLALQRWGQVDILINNAGVGRPRPVHESDDAFLDSSLNLMLRAPFRLCREVLPHMRSGTAIVNITSTFAVVGGLRGGAYSAAKAGLTGLTLHMACEYGPAGIRCNAVAPGVVPTAITEGRYDDQGFRRINVEMTPFPRLGTVDDVVGAVVFLCSPQGSFINGQTIVVDGGWSSTKYLSVSGRTSEWISRKG
jgi:NAD(P)-dependent dehydrogenase (short-subunit alcohol dehydrogenase family)